jgi:proteasome lid subunit RPN8/RPN11
MRLLVQKADTEVGMMGVATTEDPLLITELHVIEQDASGAYFEFRDEALMKWQHEMHERGLSPEQYWRCWWHSHPGEGVTPSGTDQTTFSKNFGQCPWSIMAIISKSVEKYSSVMRVRQPSSPGVAGIECDIDAEVQFMKDYSLDPESHDYVGLFRPEEWLEELKLVHPIVTKPTTTVVTTGHTRGQMGFYSRSEKRGPTSSEVFPQSRLKWFGTYQVEKLIAEYGESMDDTGQVTPEHAAMLARLWHAYYPSGCEELVEDEYPGSVAYCNDQHDDDMYYELVALSVASRITDTSCTNLLLNDARLARIHINPQDNWVSCYDDDAAKWDANKLKSYFDMENDAHQILAQIIRTDWDIASFGVIGLAFLSQHYDAVVYEGDDDDDGDKTIDLAPEDEDDRWQIAMAEWEAEREAHRAAQAEESNNG